MTADTGDFASSSKRPKKNDERDGGDFHKSNGGMMSAGLARRRVFRACEPCRKKKIKCDGVEPYCGQCQSSGATCAWMQTKDRAALSRQYVQELENRVMKLESILSEVSPQLNLTTLTMGPSPQTAPQQHTSTHSNVPSTPPSSNKNSSSPPVSRNPGLMAGRSDLTRDAKPRMDRRNSDELVAEQMGTLALDDHGHLRWIGGSSTMSLIEAFRNFSASEERDYAPSPSSSSAASQTPNPPSANLLYFPSSLRFDKVRALPGVADVEYPPPDLAEKLVEAYFEKFHHTLPILDSISFRNKYRRLMESREGDGVFGTTKSDAGFVSVVFAVYAVAARFVDDARLNDDESGEDAGGLSMVYYERAMILFYIGVSATQLAHVQSLVLLSSYLSSLNCLPKAWLLCGQAVRIAQDLGLHRSPRHLLMSPTNKETRRKVWWCVYGLDRMLAAALGRPLGTEDSDCDVELPLPVDDTELAAYFSTHSPSSRSPDLENSVNTLMSGFIALTRLYVIVGRILRTVFAVDAVEMCKESAERTQELVAALDNELVTWCDELPSIFKTDPKSPQQISLGAILCSTYYSANITLHRNFLPTKRKGIPNPNWASVPKAVLASRSCILLSLTTKDALPRSHHLAFFVQALFSAAVIILLCARFATVESAARTASEEVNTALICLNGLEDSWPGAKKCKEMLQELVEATRRDMRVQVPGVGRPGNVNGFVAPTPEGVEKVQTVYNSFKRTAHEGRRETLDREPGPDEKATRKIKNKPRSRSRIAGEERRKISHSPSPRESPNISGPSINAMDSEMSITDVNSPERNPFIMPESQPMSVFPSNDSRNESTYSSGIMNLGPGPSFAPGPMDTYSQDVFGSATQVPHDWLPSPHVDNYGVPFTHIPIDQSPPYQFKAPHTGSQDFDFNSSEIPFTGFDFLNDFGQPNAVSGFGDGEVAAWSNFVGTGVFNNVPEQPFALVDGPVIADEQRHSIDSV